MMKSTIGPVETGQIETPTERSEEGLPLETTALTLDDTQSPALTGKMIKTAAYCATFISLGLVSSSLGPTLLGLAENTQTQVREISFLFTARSFGYMLGSLLSGRLYDRIPGHAMMAGALIAMMLMMALTPLLSLLWLLVLVLLLLGMAEGGVDVGGNTLLIWIHRHKVGPFMNALHFFFGVGASLGPAIIAQVIPQTGGITWAYWILALLILPTALWLIRLPSPAIQTISAADPQLPRSNYLLVALIAGFFFLYVGAEIGFAGWIFTYAVTLNLAEEAYAAYLTSAFWGAFTLGRLFTIPIAMRFRPRIILFSNLAGALVSVAIILLWLDSLLALWLGILGIGLSLASVFPVTLALAERRMVITGKITGIFLVGASLGGMLIPWLIGQLFNPFGPWIMMVVVLVILLADLAVLIILLLNSERRHTLPVNPAAIDPEPPADQRPT
jgi:FHS family Na+ dependent glucose MFS transporter 1